MLGGTFHDHWGFPAKNKPTLSFTGVLPIEFSGHQPKSFEPVSPPRSHGVTDRISVGINQIPLRDLCDLCAMLSLMRVFPAPKATLSTKILSFTTPIPPL
jgi:hypothetical protein